MYTPPYTRWEDRDAALTFAADCNFAMLVTVAEGAPLVSHLPFLIDAGRNVLRGHLARANPHTKHIDGRGQLAVFVGPHAYVSPAWYGEASEDVPTWNYVTVHVTGCGRVLSDEAAVDAFLADLADHEERRRPDLKPGARLWTTDKVPVTDLLRMRRAIVAFEIDIEKVDAKRKLSQNKSTEAAARVAEKLAASGSQTSEAVGVLMRALRR